MFRGKHRQGHNDQLAGDESDQRTECAIHKTIGVQTDARHVHSKPGETDHDVAKDAHHGKASFTNQADPARVGRSKSVAEPSEALAIA